MTFLSDHTDPETSPEEQITLPKKRFVKTPAPAADLFSRPVYLCQELGRTSARAGAYDAYDLPSLYGEQRKAYRFSRDE